MKAIKDNAFWVSKVFNQDTNDPDWTMYKMQSSQRVPCYRALGFDTDSFYSLDNPELNSVVYSVFSDGFAKQTVSSIKRVGVSYSLQSALSAGVYQVNDNNSAYLDITFTSDGLTLYQATTFDSDKNSSGFYKITLQKPYELSKKQNVSFISFKPKYGNSILGSEFKPDGSKLFLVVRNDNNKKYYLEAYELRKAWDITTANLVQYVSLSDGSLKVRFSSDGKLMFILLNPLSSNALIKSYKLDSPWNISTYQLVEQKEFGSKAYAFTFSKTGDRLLILGDDKDTSKFGIHEYQLGSSWSLASFQHIHSIKLTNSLGWWGLTFSSDGSRLFASYSYGKVYQWALQYNKILLGPPMRDIPLGVLKQLPSDLYIVMEKTPERCIYKDTDVSHLYIKCEKNSLIMNSKIGDLIDVGDDLKLDNDVNVQILERHELETGVYCKVVGSSSSSDGLRDIKYIKYSRFDELVCVARWNNSVGVCKFDENLENLKVGQFVTNNDTIDMNSIGGTPTSKDGSTYYIPIAGYMFYNCGDGLTWRATALLVNLDTLAIRDWKIWCEPGTSLGMMDESNTVLTVSDNPRYCTTLRITSYDDNNLYWWDPWGKGDSSSDEPFAGSVFVTTDGINHYTSDKIIQYSLGLSWIKIGLDPTTGKHVHILGIDNSKNLISIAYNTETKKFTKACKVVGGGFKALYSRVYPIDNNKFIVSALTTDDKHAFIVLRKNSSNFLEPETIYVYNCDFMRCNYAKNDTKFYIQFGTQYILGINKDIFVLPNAIDTIRLDDIYKPSLTYLDLSISNTTLSYTRSGTSELKTLNPTYRDIQVNSNSYIDKSAVNFKLSISIDKSIKQVVIPSRLKKESISSLSVMQNVNEEFAIVETQTDQTNKHGRSLRFAIKGHKGIVINKVEIDLWKS